MSSITLMFQDQLYIYITVTYLLVTVCQFPSVSSGFIPLSLQASELGLLFLPMYIGSMNGDVIHVLLGEG